jgi:hypothetical protein
MKLKLLLFIMAFSFASAVSAQDWIYVGQSAKDESKYYIRSTPVANNYHKKVWIKQTNKKITIQKNGKSVVYNDAYDLILYEFNCNDRQILIHSMASYSSTGTLLESYKPEEYEKEWSDVIPDSVGEMLLNKACELY